MPRFYHAQNNFQAGQLSPKLRGRTDIEEYRRGLHKLQNFNIESTGGVSKRLGIAREGTFTVDEKAKAIHIPFSDERNSAQLYLRIYYGTNPKIILDDQELSSYLVSSARFKNYCLLPYSANVFDIVESVTDLAALDPYGFDYIQAGVYLVVTHKSGKIEPFVISPTVDTGILGAETYALFRVYQDLPPIAGTVSVPNNCPWVMPIFYKIPFDNVNKTSDTLAIASSTLDASTTLTSSSAIFEPNYINALFILDNKANPALTAVVRVTATTGTAADPSTTATVRVVAASSGFPTSATDFWYEGSWSDRKGWPECIAAFENRIIYAGSPDAPTKLWASTVGSVGHLNPYMSFVNLTTYNYIRDLGASPKSSDPYSFELSAGIAERLSWIDSARTLLVGTNQRELVLSGGDAPISNTNFPQVQTIGRIGSSAVKPFIARNSVFSVSRNGDHIIESKYSPDNGSYISQRVSKISDVLQVNKEIVTRLAYLPLESLGFILCLSGRLYTFTVNEFQEDVGFASMVYDTGLEIFDICFTPKITAATNDRVYFFYNREDIATDNVGNIDAFSEVKEYDVSKNFHFLDDWGRFGNSVDAQIIAVSGLTPDKTYTIIDADGDTFEADANGAGTQIPIPADRAYDLASSFIIGLPYTARLETMPLEVGPNFIYSSRGDLFRIDKAHIELFNTYELEYGSFNEGEEILYPLEVPAGAPFTGNKPVEIPSSSSNDTRVVVQSKSPFNVSVLGLLLRGSNAQV